MKQPTLLALRTAMQIAVAIDTECAYIDLRRIRERKTTWVGCDENALRVEIDRLIRSECAFVSIEPECAIGQSH